MVELHLDACSCFGRVCLPVDAEHFYVFAGYGQVETATKYFLYDEEAADTIYGMMETAAKYLHGLYNVDASDTNDSVDAPCEVVVGFVACMRLPALGLQSDRVCLTVDAEHFYVFVGYGQVETATKYFLYDVEASDTIYGMTSPMAAQTPR